MNKLVILLSLLLVGCMRPADPPVANSPDPVPKTARFRVERIDNDYVYLYLITDKKTERQYIAGLKLSITELGRSGSDGQGPQP